MKFSYNWLKEFIAFKETPDKLAEILNLHSFEVETIEKIGSDFALDAKVPTNRISDSGNHVGLAREIAAILQKNSKSEYRQPGVDPYSKNQKTLVNVKITNPELCPRYTAQVLEIKKIGQSPKWMQERLVTCGFRPIDAVVDTTNYVMLETGQPLHAFDLDKIRGSKITIRESRKNEELTTLDGTKHVLPKGTIVIEDANRLIDLAGIMGGENSAVSRGTKKILLQAAVFDPVRIYKASHALHFSSAASKLYAAGLDPNQTPAGLNRALGLFEKIIKAQRAGPPIDIYPKKQESLRILFHPNYANSAIGVELAPIFYKTIFERLGFRIEKESNNLLVEIPTIRRDIQIEEDLIEEAARIFGYEKIPARPPEATLRPTSRNDEIWWEERVRDFLAGAGFTESRLYEFTGDEELGKFYIDPDEAILLENPMSPGTKYLLPRALIKYIFSASENLRNFDNVGIFGIGKSFLRKKVSEHKDLSIVLTQKNTTGEEEFYRLKGVADELLESLGISDHWYDDKVSHRLSVTGYKLFHPYRLTEIKVGDEKIGSIGEIHPAVLENIKAKARIVAAEIDFEKLWRLARSEQEFRPIGKYPAIIRDIAVIVPQTTKADEVEEIIENTAGPLLTDSDLFDYFQDEEKKKSEEKSLAFHLVFQSPERTLEDGEVNSIIEKIVESLEKSGWEIRK